MTPPCPERFGSGWKMGRQTHFPVFNFYRKNIFLREQEPVRSSRRKQIPRRMTGYLRDRTILTQSGGGNKREGTELLPHRIFCVLERFTAGRRYFEFVSVLHGQIEETDFVDIFQADSRGTADHGKAAGGTDSDITDIRLDNAAVGAVHIEAQVSTEIQEGGHGDFFGSVHKADVDRLFIHRPGVHDIFFLQIEGLSERAEFEPLDLTVFDGKQLVAHG